MGKRWDRVKSMFGRRPPGVAANVKSAANQVTLYVLPDGFTPQVSFLGDSLDATLEAAVWSYACIVGNAEACGSLPGIIQRRGSIDDDQGKWVRVESPLERFVDQPFPAQVGLPAWGWQQVVEQACLQLDLCGDSYWRILPTPNSARPWIEPIHPSDIRPIISRGRLVEYLWTPTAREAGSAGPVVSLDPDSVVHISNTAPGTLFRGQSPTRAANRTIQIDLIAQQRQQANLENRAQPGLVVTISGLFGVTQDQRTEIETYLRENYSKAAQEGTPIVLGEGTVLNTAPISSADMQYIDSRKLSREEVLAIYKTPPPIVGVYDQATLQNFGEARRLWWTVALFPRVRSVIDAFNRQLIRQRWPDQRIWYDTTDTDIGLQILDTKLDIALKYSKLGYPTNAINAQLGLGMPTFPELDIPNVQLVEAGRTDSGTASLAAAGIDPASLGDTPTAPSLSILTR